MPISGLLGARGGKWAQPWLAPRPQGPQSDTIDGTNEPDAIVGTAGPDRLRGFGGDDLLVGGGHVDFLRGKTGDDDVLFGDAGDDVLDGGKGADYADYGKSSGSLVVDLGAGTATGDGADILISIEHVFTNRGADVLIGTDGANHLVGHSGSDTLTGGGAQDTLVGYTGVDTFIFTDIADSRRGKPDQLDAHGGDVIDVSAIDADINTPSDDAFVLVIQFHDAPGELRVRYDAGLDKTLVEAVDGDGRRDMLIELDGDQSGFDNFVL